jgi:hypothetical protein
VTTSNAHQGSAGTLSQLRLRCQSSARRSEQVIVHQRGLFLITLGADRRVRAEIDGVVLEPQPISDEECHSIVFTADFNRSLSPSAALPSRVSVLK